MQYVVGLRVNRNGDYFQFFTVSKSVVSELSRDEKIDLVVAAVDVVAEVLTMGVEPLPDPSTGLQLVLDDGREVAYSKPDEVRASLDGLDLNESYAVGPTLWSVEVTT